MINDSKSRVYGDFHKSGCLFADLHSLPKGHSILNLHRGRHGLRVIPCRVGIHLTIYQQ